MSDNAKKTALLLPIITVLSLCFADALTNYLTPAMADFANLYPAVEPALVAQIISVPTLFYMISSVVAGGMADKFGYKPMLIAGLTLILVGGMVPMALSDFTVVLIFRAVFGLGIGICMALSKALIALMFEGELRARLYGYQNTLGTVIMAGLQILAGYVVVVNARAAYAIHGVAAIALVMVIFVLKEPEKKTETAVQKDAENQSAGRAHVPALALILIIMFTLRALPMITIMLNTSGMLLELGVGDASTGGLVSACMTGGTLAAGVLFVYSERIFKNYTAAAGLTIEIIGGLLMSFGTSVPVFILSYILMGFGMITFAPAMNVIVAKTTPKAAMGTAMGLLVSIPYLANFVAPYYMLTVQKILANYTTQGMFKVGVAIQVVLAVILYYSIALFRL